MSLLDNTNLEEEEIKNVLFLNNYAKQGPMQDTLRDKKKTLAQH